MKQTKTKESDRVLTVLSGELGIITIYAKGAMRLKNKFYSATNVFNYSEFVVYESNFSNMYQLNEATSKTVFYKLSQDIEKISLAMYMSELITEVTVPDEIAKDILRFFLNMLHVLSEDKWSVKLCKACFEMRLLSDIGYRPNLLFCSMCHDTKEGLYFFSPYTGDIVCENCKKNISQNLFICDSAVLMALKYIAYADLDKMFKFNLVGESLNNLVNICEFYALYHTKTEYKTLDFLRSLEI